MVFHGDFSDGNLYLSGLVNDNSQKGYNDQKFLNVDNDGFYLSGINQTITSYFEEFDERFDWLSGQIKALKHLANNI